MGSQIAFQAAYCGFDVTIWLRSRAASAAPSPRSTMSRGVHRGYRGHGGRHGRVVRRHRRQRPALRQGSGTRRRERAYSTLKLELDLAKAVADADLVIESMAEDTQAKIDFYKKLAPVLPQKTVIVTNSSTLLPSTFAKYTGRPRSTYRCTLPIPSGRTT
ncbi:MAG: 3-hydroxyacyl-CoA dehydrogenase NAD-binding domain-containing protein [Collinsella sp.]